MKTKGVFSLWTKPATFKPERGPLLVQTLAIALARDTFREVELVTDRRGASIAAALGWQFANVRLDLERFAPAGCSHVWAAGKLEALNVQEAPAVHVDGDALLLGRRLPLRFITSPLCAQSEDLPEYYTGQEIGRALEIAGLPRGFRAFNGGLIGGADVALLQDFTAEALERVRRFAGTEDTCNGTAASMVCEQYGLGHFAKIHGAEVATLLPMRPSREDLESAGYAHLQGHEKRNPFYVGKVERRLLREYPEDYARALAGLSTVCAAAF